MPSTVQLYDSLMNSIDKRDKIKCQDNQTKGNKSHRTEIKLKLYQWNSSLSFSISVHRQTKIHLL